MDEFWNQIDDRILEGIAYLRWTQPTLIQKKAIPYMLSGKSVVAQARTGSGKTGAFLIPSLHRILLEKSTAPEQCVRVLILAPSKELCRQISEMAEKLVKSCSRELRILDLSAQVSLAHQRPLLAELPDVVIGPPGRVCSHLLAGHLSLSCIQCVVVDEADLMITYQHGESLDQLWKYLPDYYQCFITSATLLRDLKKISNLLLRNEDVLANTVVLRLQEPPLPPQLNQFVIKVEEFDKAVLLYSLYRLQMISGKTIIFVNSLNKGYKLRMFLGQFGISSCILNSELPGNCRCNIIEQFNAGRYDTIIATDPASLAARHSALDDVEVDLESGTSRGLDFQFVSNIVNFDFPTTLTSYIHRVGRTARGNNAGTALSMVSVAEHDTYLSIAKKLSKMTRKGQTTQSLTDEEGIFKNYVFDLNQLDGFSYRANDVWRMCSNHAIMKVRKREISQQLLNSKKLEAYFYDNPQDKLLLRHDKKQHGIATMSHLKHVPEYNLPEKLKMAAGKLIEKQNRILDKNIKKLNKNVCIKSSDDKNFIRKYTSKRAKSIKSMPKWKKGFTSKESRGISEMQKRREYKRKDPLRTMLCSTH